VAECGGRFFAILTNRRLERGVFRSVTDLQATINRFLNQHNRQTKPFIWTADPDKIIAAVRRGRKVLDSIHQFDKIGLRTAFGTTDLALGGGASIPLLRQELCVDSVAAQKTESATWRRNGAS
jgi:hypothetical protein